jgi:hypothetical protein
LDWNLFGAVSDLMRILDQAASLPDPILMKHLVRPEIGRIPADDAIIVIGLSLCLE